MSDDYYHFSDGFREPRALRKAAHPPASVESIPPAPPLEAPPQEQPAKPLKRQRVVLADARSRSRPSLRARVELEEQTSWGEALIKDLVKRQLRTALVLGLPVLVVLGSLPLAFYLSPTFAALKVIGIPLAWLLLGVLPFPLMLLASLGHNRRAETHERDFVDLIDH